MTDVLTYAVGSERPAWTHEYKVEGAPVDFSSGFTFTVTCKTSDLATTSFTKTTGIAATADLITVTWTATDLGALTAGQYLLTLIPRQTAGTLDYDAVTVRLNMRPI